MGGDRAKKLRAINWVLQCTDCNEEADRGLYMTMSTDSILIGS